MTEPLLVAAEVAELLRLPVDRIYRLVRENRIPHLRLGRTVRFRAEAIERWLEQEER